jgi:predicted Zn-dependent protease
MRRFQKYEQKIRKYKDKLKNLLIKIGITCTDEFELGNTTPKQFSLPCHIGILFIGEYHQDFFEKIRTCLLNIFDSFFFSIGNLGTYNFSLESISNGVKTEYREMKKSSGKINIHPTNKFYQILINKRIEENLGMIIALTDLPLYSSSDENIIFLFGETHLKHRCCVVSSLKLKEQFYNREPNLKIFEQRVVKEIIHEIGHILIGANHCINKSCVMRFSHNVIEVDEKLIDFCENCKKKLMQIRRDYNF